LIVSCRTVDGRWFAGLELRGQVVGLPALSLADRLEEQCRSGRDVGVAGFGALPEERAVIDRVRGLDAGLVEQLPNELAPLGLPGGGMDLGRVLRIV
jgi:hypothetical protein